MGFQYTAPENLVRFILINAFVTSTAILGLRSSALSKHLLATPARNAELFLMRTTGPTRIMIVQTDFLVAVTALAFQVLWGHPLGVCVITAALIALGVSLVFLMGTVFRNKEQAGAVGPLIGVALAMLGGCMWPLEIVPPFMKTLGLASPARWATDGLPGPHLSSRRRDLCAPEHHHPARDGDRRRDGRDPAPTPAVLSLSAPPGPGPGPAELIQESCKASASPD